MRVTTGLPPHSSGSAQTTLRGVETVALTVALTV